MRISLIPQAHYYVGLDLPWYVTRGMVESKARELGFGPIDWHRAEEVPPVNPMQSPSGFSADYDLWGHSQYLGAPGEYELPARPAWLVIAQPSEISQAPHQPSAPSAPTTAITRGEEKSSAIHPALLIGGGLLIDALFIGFIFKKFRNQKGSSLMTPAAIALLGGGALALYIATRGPKPQVRKAIDQYQLDKMSAEQLYQVGMNTPTSDVYFYEAVLYLLQKKGRGDLYTGVWNRAQGVFQQLQAQAVAKAQAQAAGQAARAANR